MAESSSNTPATVQLIRQRRGSALTFKSGDRREDRPQPSVDPDTPSRVSRPAQRAELRCVRRREVLIV
jgi:hypothetical protein